MNDFESKLTPDGLCTFGVSFGDPAAGALLCHLPKGHEVKHHSTDTFTFFDLAGHEGHRLRRMHPAFDNTYTCACGATVKFVCDCPHAPSAARLKWAWVDGIAKVACGCKIEFTIS